MFKQQIGRHFTFTKIMDVIILSIMEQNIYFRIQNIYLHNGN